jgi:hypothetical protein
MSPPASSFIAICVQTLLTDGPHSLSASQCKTLEDLRDGVLDIQLCAVKATAKVAKTTEKSAPAENTGKRKKTKAANASVQLPTGTPVYRTIGGKTFDAAWNNEDRTLLWEGNVYPSPTAFCRACYASIHGPDKPHAINGQAACYVLREGKRVTLEKLRDEAAAPAGTA